MCPWTQEGEALGARGAPSLAVLTTPLLSSHCCMCVFSACLPEVMPHYVQIRATNPWCPLPKSGPDLFRRVLIFLDMIFSFKQRSPFLVIKLHSNWGIERKRVHRVRFVLIFYRMKLLFWLCLLGTTCPATTCHNQMLSFYSHTLLSTLHCFQRVVLHRATQQPYAHTHCWVRGMNGSPGSKEYCTQSKTERLITRFS